jgi:D-alanyl-D-alanine carboxypeptidase
MVSCIARVIAATVLSALCACARTSVPASPPSVPAAPTSVPVEPSSAIGQQIDALLNATVAHQRLAGVSLAVARDGAILYAKGYGYRDMAKRLPATPQTIYNIASNSKQFTAACVLLLQQDGKLNIDDKLSKYLPELPYAGEVTIREVLNHTSGLSDYLDIVDNTSLTPAKVYGALPKLKLRFPPGSKYEYSNSNYIIAGLVVARVSGMSYDEFLRKRILVPLDLRSTSVGTAPKDLPDGALGYMVVKGRIVPTVQQTVAILDFPDGNVNSTVLDLVKWDDALDSGRVVDEQMLKMMFTPSAHKTDWQDGYGLGVAMGHIGAHREIVHTGGWTGFSSENATFPDDRFAIILLSNNDEFSKDALVKRIFTLFYPSP